MGSTPLPRRSRRFGVGKEIGGAVYVHRVAEHVLGPDIQRARERIPDDFAYTVVKLNLRTGAVTFTYSPDFDDSPEPVVSDQWIVRDCSAKFRRQPSDPYLYHHKWLMVPESYSDFDLVESRRRSEPWLSIPGVDKARIGRRSYWCTAVVPQIQDSMSA